MNKRRTARGEASTGGTLRNERGGIDATLLTRESAVRAVFDDFDLLEDAWSEIERLPLFPNRTNVRFVKLQDEKTLDVRFFNGARVHDVERDSSTGAFAAARLRGLIERRTTVRTQAGRSLSMERERSSAGPGRDCRRGEFYFEP